MKLMASQEDWIPTLCKERLCGWKALFQELIFVTMVQFPCCCLHPPKNCAVPFVDVLCPTCLNFFWSVKDVGNVSYACMLCQFLHLSDFSFMCTSERYIGNDLSTSSHVHGGNAAYIWISPDPAKAGPCWELLLLYLGVPIEVLLTEWYRYCYFFTTC